jgi:hypothetical protein
VQETHRTLTIEDEDEKDDFRPINSGTRLLGTVIGL